MLNDNLQASRQIQTTRKPIPTGAKQGLKSALSLVALPPGVERHGNALRINFNYKGVRCREIVARGQVDDVDIIMAGRQRDKVVRAIAAGTFNYFQSFLILKRRSGCMNLRLIRRKVFPPRITFRI